MSVGRLLGILSALLLSVACDRQVKGEPPEARRPPLATPSVPAVLIQESADSVFQTASLQTASLQSGSSRQEPSSKSQKRLSVFQLTTAGASDDDVLPWVIAIHGLGDRAENFARALRGLPFPVHLYVPQAPISWGSGGAWFTARVKGDPAQLAEAIREALPALELLISELSREKRNRGAPVVTGFSQGGMLSYALALWGKVALAGSVPISGMLPPALIPTSVEKRGPPIWGLHGTKDRMVPLGPTEEMIGQLRSQGRPVKLATFGTAHTIDVNMRLLWVQHLLELTQPAEEQRRVP